MEMQTIVANAIVTNLIPTNADKERGEKLETSCILQKSHPSVDRQCGRQKCMGKRKTITSKTEEWLNGKIHVIVQKENKSTKDCMV